MILCDMNNYLSIYFWEYLQLYELVVLRIPEIYLQVYEYLYIF